VATLKNNLSQILNQVNYLRIAHQLIIITNNEIKKMPAKKYFNKKAAQLHSF